ncbi:3TM-type holin [Halomonas sp. IOP_31]|uniref:3TM-type holin n=1 Tax=Halomonas sp. IOP_31 TaxID=2876584 RepID=UPI001E659CFA|nr:3TM-type holin [Halomonas sp. IOP_31]MCD6006896.1 hypothetical protein [Halomonas sp. IOP_31]
MEWSDVKNAVASVAPALGTALAGPAGTAVGGLLATALGVEQTPEAVSAAVRNDPQAAVTLREIEANLERARLESRSNIITAEAQGESWLQRNWRPLLMMWFAALVGGYWFGLTPDNLSQDTVLALFDIVQLGVGGYIAGRSAEKITRTITGTGLMDNIKAKVK